jgi:hypothetical protein
MEQMPGRFPSYHGWRDPYKILGEYDPQGTILASVLAQEGVESWYSGALTPMSSGEPLIEGVRGKGDSFMQGGAAPETIPSEVSDSIRNIYRRAFKHLGSVRLEWVHDGRSAWVVQIHIASAIGDDVTIFPGSPESYVVFDAARGLDALREFVSGLKDKDVGIALAGNVGITSHLGDLLRRARVPSRLRRTG